MYSIFKLNRINHYYSNYDGIWVEDVQEIASFDDEEEAKKAAEIYREYLINKGYFEAKRSETKEGFELDIDVSEMHESAESFKKALYKD